MVAQGGRRFVDGTRRIVRMGQLGRLVVPQDIRDALEWNADVRLVVEVHGRIVEIKRAESVCVVCGKQLEEGWSYVICQQCHDEITTKRGADGEDGD